MKSAKLQYDSYVLGHIDAKFISKLVEAVIKIQTRITLHFL